MKKKLILGISCFLLILIFVFIFAKSEYKGTISGNNISKSDKTDILSISSYEATVVAEVHSNKNTNKYILKQKYSAPNVFSQEVLEPETIQGLKITNSEGETTLENTKLGLKKIYEDFNRRGFGFKFS